MNSDKRPKDELGKKGRRDGAPGESAPANQDVPLRAPEDERKLREHVDRKGHEHGECKRRDDGSAA